MGEEKDDQYQAAVDVNIIAIAMVENPAQEQALSIVERMLKNEIRALVPVTVIFGAYIVLTRVLRVRKKDAAYALSSLVKSQHIDWHETVERDSVEKILECASQKGIDSWDAYLVSVMGKFGIKTLYTTDKDFSRFPELKPINPISDDKMQEYSDWLDLLKKQNA